MDNFDKEFQEKYPLCYAAGVDGNAFEETNLHNQLELVCNQRLTIPKAVNQLHIIKKINSNIKLDYMDIAKCLLLYDLPGEEWKDVVGLENRFMVSNLGRVKGLPRDTQGTSMYGNPTIRHLKSHILTAKFTTDHYFDVHIRDLGTNIYPRIHRLVAEAWIPKTEEDIRLGRVVINHRNGNKLDNRVENLEWATPQENTIDACVNKLIPNITLDADTIEQMVTDYENGMNLTDMRRKYHIRKLDTLLNAIFRKSYSWITSVRIPERRHPVCGDETKLPRNSNLKTLHDILKVKLLLQKRMSVKKIAELFHVHFMTISSISRDQAYIGFRLEDHPDLVKELEIEIKNEFGI